MFNMAFSIESSHLFSSKNALMIWKRNSDNGSNGDYSIDFKESRNEKNINKHLRKYSSCLFIFRYKGS